MRDGINGSAEATPPAEPAMFRWYPGLRESLPWVALTRVPSPVHRLANLGSALGMQELWIKRDDQCGIWYGGNKPRKLEFLLGDALAQRAGTVITFGALGSNHTLATAVCGRKLGLQTVLILVRQPLSDSVRRNLLLVHAQGAKLVYAGGSARAVLAAVLHRLKHTIGSRRRAYIILPGGSSPRGCLGYVNAALELAEQIEAGELPQPDNIFVPVGSNGTMAGLEVGLRLAGLETRVVGVRVSDRLPIGPRAVARLANRCWALLHQHAPGLPKGYVDPSQIAIRDGYLGNGYAHSTPEGHRAVHLMSEREGIRLDDVYTGKTLAALTDASTDPTLRERRVLFWNTFNTLPLDGLLLQDYDYRLLPKAFHRVFEV